MKGRSERYKFNESAAEVELHPSKHSVLEPKPVDRYFLQLISKVLGVEVDSVKVE